MKRFTLAGFLILLTHLLAASCREAGEDGSALTPNVRAPIVMVGTWGGDQIELNVAEVWKGTAPKQPVPIVYGGGRLGGKRVTVSDQVDFQ